MFCKNRIFLLTALAIMVICGAVSCKKEEEKSESQEPAKQLSDIELCKLQSKLKDQQDSLTQLDRGDGFGSHIDDFKKYLKFGDDAMSHNDFATASDAFQRADKEAKWLNKNEAP